MDIGLTPDQRTFLAATRDFLDRTASGERLREQAEAGGFDRAWWSQAAELGWTAMAVPESLGGGTVSGEPVADLCLVAEELGRHRAPGPLLSTSAVLTGLVRSGDAHAEEIDKILTGEHLATWAVYRPDQGWAPLPDATTARPAPGGGYVVSGAADRVEYGDLADVLLVTARSPDGPVQVLVPRAAPGVTVAPTWSLDATRTFARVGLVDVAVTPAAVVHEGPDAEAAVEAQLLTAATLACAEMCGAVAAMFATTLTWMSDRYTFGRPLASYQALKHRMADDKTWYEACQATTWGAARALDSAADDAAELVGVAKAYVGDKAPEMLQDFVQLHGGLGVTWEHDLHLFLRRVLCDRALYGTPEEHRRRIAAIMAGRAA
ncbi:MAG TPA: acyl-CoA dehydrogenase family protein [Streptosporangiaceae bacterium]